MSVSIDTIIKQAMVEAGIDPLSHGKAEKKSAESKLANSLYELADKLEDLGDIPIGVHKSASSEKSSLRELTKAYLFQQMLKSAVEERFGVTNDLEKSAGSSDMKVEYLEAFEKLAAEKKALSSEALKLIGTTLALGAAGGVGYGGYQLGKHTEKPSVPKALLSWGVGGFPGGIGYSIGRGVANQKKPGKLENKEN